MSLAPVKSSPTAQDSAVISINGLVKQFGRFAALRGVSAEFTPGRLYVILGDNGAGKTTLLRSLAGLAQPTRGTITILGTTDLRTVCGQIGYMAHPSLLYDEMSAMENMRYFARLYEICDDATCARVITAVGLDPALARPVAQYSQGMRQRLSLARAILHDPKILLLDEPFSNVDVQSARAMAAVVALNQTWARELRNQVLDAYRVSPAPANSLFMAKALGNFVFVVLLEALMTPLFIMFYQLRALGPEWQLIPVAVLGTWALVVNGTFFAAMSIRTRNREIMLPLLLFPFSIPALLAMVNATTAILTGELSARSCIALLATYDVVFTIACLLLFESVLQAE